MSLFGPLHYSMWSEQHFIDVISSSLQLRYTRNFSVETLCVLNDHWVKGSLPCSHCQPRDIFGNTFMFISIIHAQLHSEQPSFYLLQSRSVSFVTSVLLLLSHSLSPWSLSLYISLSWLSTAVTVWYRRRISSSNTDFYW